MEKAKTINLADAHENRKHMKIAMHMHGEDEGQDFLQSVALQLLESAEERGVIIVTNEDGQDEKFIVKAYGENGLYGSHGLLKEEQRRQLWGQHHKDEDGNSIEIVAREYYHDQYDQDKHDLGLYDHEGIDQADRIAEAIKIANPKLKKAIEMILQGKTFKEAAFAIGMDASQFSKNLASVGEKLTGRKRVPLKKKATTKQAEGQQSIFGGEAA